MTPEQRNQYGREWILERAAIIEIDGGLPRKEAERQAVEQWHKMCRNEPELQTKAS